MMRSSSASLLLLLPLLLLLLLLLLPLPSLMSLFLHLIFFFTFLSSLSRASCESDMSVRRMRITQQIHANYPRDQIHSNGPNIIRRPPDYSSNLCQHRYDRYDFSRGCFGPASCSFLV